MTIEVFTGFSKRKNSTKHPTAGTGTSKTVTLKEGTSIENPSFLLAGDLFTVDYVNAFGNWYFVTDVKSVKNGLTEISCKMDSLATHKSTIANYTAFIERAASSGAINIDLPDPLCASEVTERVIPSVTSGSFVFSSTGCFVLSVLNTKGSGAGFTSYYLLDATKIEAVATYCNSYWGNTATTVTEWFQANYLKTSEAIIDCIWVPFSYSYTASLSFAHEKIEIGVDEITVGGDYVWGYRFTAGCVASYTATIAIPNTGYSDFRRGAPYTIGKLYIPCYGVIDFNPLDFTTGNITLTIDADFATGDVIVYLKDGTYLISTVTYNCAAPCPVGKVGTNISGAASGIIQTAGAVIGMVASSGAASVAAGISATAAGINAVSNAIAPTMSIHGGRGGRAASYNGTDFICTLICKETSDPAELMTHHGGLVMEKKQISSLSGYIKCSNASVPIAGMETEREEVNSYLNSGFYYE